MIDKTLNSSLEIHSEFAFQKKTEHFSNLDLNRFSLEFIS